MLASTRRPEPFARRCAVTASAAVVYAAAACAQAQEGLTRAVKVIGPTPPGAVSAPPPVALPVGPKLKNTVGLTLDVLPGSSVPVGSPMSFRVAGRKDGYVILVDIDASGKLTQIFPNVISLALGDGSAKEENHVAPNKSFAIPPAGSKIYEFVAAPPLGVGMVVAIFSETPLQMIDLPDVPSALAGQADAATFLGDAANNLRIVPADGSGGFLEPKLSFEARFYQIR